MQDIVELEAAASGRHAVLDVVRHLLVARLPRKPSDAGAAAHNVGVGRCFQGEPKVVFWALARVNSASK